MLHPTSAAGIATAADHVPPADELLAFRRAIRLAVPVALFCWLAFGAFLLGALR